MQKNKNQSNTIKVFLFCLILCYVISRLKNKLFSKFLDLPDLNQYPVIGIYAQPSSQKKEYVRQYYQYVLNANIKWIQMQGAQTVIIPFDETQEYYDNMFSKINGILFTGGSLNININIPVDQYQPKTGNNQWTQNAAYLINKAIKANDDGDFFPIWGNCQGFQLLHYIISGYNYTILNYITNDFNTTRNAQFFNLGSSSLFQQFDQQNLQYSQTNSPFLYLHELGVTEEDYKHNPSLKDFFQILGVSVNSTNFQDQNAFRYLAIVEGKNYPFMGVQFHPEYTIFETSFDSNHSLESLSIASYFSRYFVSLARKNGHKFSNIEERSSFLSYNYPTAHIEGYLFNQVTFMDRKQNN